MLLRTAGRRLLQQQKQQPRCWRLCRPSRSFSAASTSTCVSERLQAAFPSSSEDEQKQRKELLRGLGVQKAADLSYVQADDLIKAGMTVVDARKLVDAPQPAAAALTDVSSFLPPLGAIEAAAAAGLKRSMRPAGVIFASSVMGGCFLSFGGMMFAQLAGGTPMLQASLPGLHSLMGAAVFPIGLSMIVFTGTDLLTSTMLYTSLPFLTHPRNTAQANLATMGKSWTLNFAGNFVGSLALAGCAASAMCFAAAPYSTWITALATEKCGLSFGTALVKGIGANWLVNVAVFMALASRSAIGKIAALWLPITTFVTLGFEHSVANMFLVPLGIFCGADVTFAQFAVNNLLPVTIGNAIGAAVFVGGFHWYADWWPAHAAKQKELPMQVWGPDHVSGSDADKEKAEEKRLAPR